ncbi:MAG: hypothetical protein F6K19_24135 [Cyanothece sp. SIO1E1]|nr:hypothetical protein [Cyanothece sp. SIO1E1]
MSKYGESAIQHSKPSLVRKAVSALIVSTCLVGAAGLVLGGSWLSLYLIVDPSSVPWINRILSRVTHGSDAEPTAYQTLSEIELSLNQTGIKTGPTVTLSHQANSANLASEPTDILVPIIDSRSNCQRHCEHIVELRVYRPRLTFNPKREQRFELVDQISVSGPDEFFVVAPLNHSRSDNVGSSRKLPLNNLKPIQGKAPQSGTWLTLQGERVREGTKIIYGHVLHYDARRARLTLMLPWTSPAAQLPRWQELNDQSPPELVIDQTKGLEPSFKAYQLVSTQYSHTSFQLETISLSEFVLPDQAYQDALLLARHGLWSESLRSLAKATNHSTQFQQWPAAAKAQIKLIEQHAQVTQAQANRTWASPSQKVLAALIDGRWQSAMALFEQSPAVQPGILSLLKADSGQLWRRITATLQVNPKQLEAQIWGALMLAAQQDQAKAIAWLQQQKHQSSATENRVRQLLAQTQRRNQPFVTVNQRQSVARLNRHPSRILGSAMTLANIDPKVWLRPQPTENLSLSRQQVWYQIQIDRFHNGEQWLRSPFPPLQLPPAAIAQQLWQDLGLDTNVQMQVLNWTADGQLQSADITVKAVQVQPGSIQLLAAGPPMFIEQGSTAQFQLLAVTPATLNWVDPAEATTLTQLAPPQPDWSTTIETLLWQELQPTEQILSEPSVGWQELLQQIQTEPVQLIDLTGDGTLEVVLSVPSIFLDQSTQIASHAQVHLHRSKPGTLIFSQQGDLLHSDLGAVNGQSLVAIATLEAGAPPILIIASPQGYKWQQWSSERQVFE